MYHSAPVAGHDLVVRVFTVDCSRRNVHIPTTFTQEIVENKTGQNKLNSVLWLGVYVTQEQPESAGQDAECVFRASSGPTQPVVEHSLRMR